MRRVYVGVLAGALISLGLGSTALAADQVEPLNQYTVTSGDPASLAKLGYDVVEGDGSGIVATPSQADALRAKGFGIKPLGKEDTAKVAAASAVAPLADPTWGYDVYRPWNLKPAPCQTTCSGAVDANGAADLAEGVVRRAGRGQPDDRQARGLRHLADGPGARRLPRHQGRADDRRRHQARRDVQRHPARPRVDLHRGRAARVQVRPRPRERRRLGHPGDPRQGRAVVRPGPEPRRLRLHVPVARHAPVAQEPARQQQQRHADQRRRRGHQPQLRREVALRQRGRGGRDEHRRLPRHGAGVRARGVGLPRPDAPDPPRLPDRLPLLREARPVPRRLAGRDLRRRRSGDDRAGRRRSAPGGRGL